MTAGVIHTIRCDRQGGNGEQCDQEWYAPIPMANHRALRAHLRELGWHRTRDGRDICPDCWKASHRCRSEGVRQ